MNEPHDIVGAYFESGLWALEGTRKWGGNRWLDAPSRFWPKVHFTDSCWLWVGKLQNGYGRFSLKGRGVYAHRWAYEFCVGPIPLGLPLDHLCRVRQCVNPAHLEPVTVGINILRGYGACAQHARKTHCSQGHPLSGANLYLRPNGHRRCIACRRLTAHRQWLRRKGQVHAA